MNVGPAQAPGFMLKAAEREAERPRGRLFSFPLDDDKAAQTDPISSHIIASALQDCSLLVAFAQLSSILSGWAQRFRLLCLRHRPGSRPSRDSTAAIALH